jgi:DNA replication and repair protein RecF
MFHVEHSGAVPEPGLRSLRIESLRNIGRLDLTMDTRTLLLTGANGAGKTSILEAIYLLARGRTFRGTKAGPLTTNGASYTRIEGVYQPSDREAMRIRYVKEGATATRDIYPPVWPEIGGEDWRSLLQVKLIGENAQTLLDGEPSLRRRFLDWNVFHVEHRFARLHKDFTRLLMQRNAAIRAGGGQRGLWDRSFIELAESMDRQRASFYAEWRACFLNLRDDYPFLRGADLHYRRGWPEGRGLSETLDSLADQELARGYTLAGPSRADFRVESGEGRRGFSRGQAKIVVALLQLAAECIHRAHGRAPVIWLLDDIEAELDRSMAERLWNAFGATDNPVIATRVSTDGDPGIFSETKSLAMFHVEHLPSAGTYRCRRHPFAVSSGTLPRPGPGDQPANP